MHAGTQDFASLLHPVSTAEFFRGYWECRPLLIPRNDADFYAELLTNRDLEDIISGSDLRYPAIRLAKNGSYYPPQAYTTDVTLDRLTFHGVPDVNRISLEYGRGATISLPSLHRTWAPLGSLCLRVEAALDYATHANVYITPGAASGFPAHYDTHEVLVLQIAGRKRWLIDEPPLKLPHSSQRFRSAGFMPGPRMMEVELAAGDALYLPRGFVHSTTTSGCHSAHVTIGINVLTWADLAWELVPSCVENEEYRRALPPGFASRAELRPAVKQQLMRMLPGSPVDHDALIDRAIAVVQAGRRQTPARFRADVVAITADSLLQTPVRQRYGVARSTDRLQLGFDGRTFVFPGAMGGILEAMCARPAFRVADLAAGADAETALTFARALQSIGFLQVIARSSPPA
ncbi:MAG TPA: cupin domain-containing protein [Steroidobacteraceae bacterium]|nr:cupin domain-containing protein [Steroidobacteraceae bacterium]